MKLQITIQTGTRFSSRSGYHYRMLDRIGDGGNSSVFLAIDTSSEKRGVVFAVKCFANLEDENRLEQFYGEIEVLRYLNHPAMMKIFDSGIIKIPLIDEQIAKFPFVIAEYLPRTFRGAIRANDLTLAEKLSFTLQLLSALQYLSSRQPQIVHRDIKPDNVFVKGRSCILGDFGLMKLLTQLGEEDRAFFKVSGGPGMPRFYRTPDLVAYARNEADLTTKSDVFQLGLVLAELFTGFNPLKRAKNFLDPVELEGIRPIPGDTGERIANLIREMLHIDPATRKTATELFDPWDGVFQEVVTSSLSLEGRLFR